MANKMRMIKAPEIIIKGLTICTNTSEDCTGCPYLDIENGDCVRTLLKDAKTLTDLLLEAENETT